MKVTKSLLLRLYLKFENLISMVTFVSLVEYALIVALITFGVTVCMVSLAAGFTAAFSNISSKLSSYTY